MKTVDAFDAKLQAVVTHVVTVDGNGEFLFQSTESDAFFKLPATEDKEELMGLIERHEEANTGQISVEGQEKLLEELFGDVEDEEVDEDLEPEEEEI